MKLRFSTLWKYRCQRLGYRMGLLLSIGLGIFIWGMVNYLSARHYIRTDISRYAYFELSERTAQLLESITGDIRVYALLRPSHEAEADIRELLREYQAHAPSMQLEILDPDRNLARAEELARRYRLDETDSIIFDLNGRSEVVRANDLIEYGNPDFSRQSHSFAVPVKTFRGEQYFSSTLARLSQSRRPTAYFVQGHGERDPNDFDRRNGYSRIATELRNNNFDVATLHLGESKVVPNNTDLLVIAGPKTQYSPFEVSLIRDFLERKGRLLLLLDARTQTNLEPLLQEWGVLLGDDIVIDGGRTLGGRELYITAYPNHAITAPLRTSSAVMFLPRSIRPIPQSGPAGDKPTVSPLALSSDLGWAEFDAADSTAYFDPQVDIPGPLPLAVAIERGPVPGVRVQIRPTRIVIFGDSAFVSNAGLMGANADLFMNSVHWLLEWEHLLAIAPKTPTDIVLMLNAKQLQRLFFIMVIGIPGIVAGLNLLLIWKRRR